MKTRLKYEYVGSIHEGLARVRLNDKYGFIDETGAEVTPLKYDDASGFSRFSEDFARVKLNDKWGLIDKNGAEITPIKYDNTWDFSEGFARVRLNGKYGFINETGVEITPLKYDCIGDFSGDFACVELNNKWGLIDKTGAEVIPLKYDMACGFTESLALVKLNGKYGFVDENGIEATPPKYDDTSYFSAGRARVKLNGKYGFVDENGIEVIPLKYDDADNFSEGCARVKLNGKYRYIDKTGAKVSPPKYNIREKWYIFRMFTDWIYLFRNIREFRKGEWVYYTIPDSGHKGLSRWFVETFVPGYQRAKYGFCYKDIWSIPLWYGTVFPKMLKELKNRNNECSGNTGYDWTGNQQPDSNEILERMIFCFSEINDSYDRIMQEGKDENYAIYEQRMEENNIYRKKMKDEGFDLLKKYFEHLSY
jgi:hypothetical protein